MQKNKYDTTGNAPRVATLSNGLRAVVRQTESLVSYIGVAIGAGSRDEEPHRHGLAHFVEHTIFKGTGTRRSWHISNRMESIGGELNAYTSKEETMVYTNAPAGYAERAIELLADIIADSRFPERELEKEREVVIEEINSYLDSPADSIYDEFEERIFADSPLAHNILGTPESVRALTGRDCREFLDLHYTPGNMVIYAADPSDPERILRLLDKYFGSLHFTNRPADRSTPPPCGGFDDMLDRRGHQAHTIIGFRLFGRNDPRRFPLFLLNNYLGGPCMNSRLNQELRDKRGLVYTVDSSVALLSDTGLMQIYCGSDRDAVGKCIRLVRREIERLASERLSDRAFRAVVDQYCGQLLVSSDHKENMAMSMAKSLMYFGEVHDIGTTTRLLREVTSEQIRDLAGCLASAPLCRLTIC
ncbi:MAG: insulinase family protein [Muribaculaceae bacterium]|nr:insulinase family protein [Muribaculaceae bacterium]